MKYPSRSRPAQFLRVFKQWVEMADDTSKILWLFSFDKDDESMFAMHQEISTLSIDAIIHFGTSNSKVEAINRDINEVTDPWDILLVISDDMVPTVKGWDTQVRSWCKDNPDSLIWFLDGKQFDICTLPCMDRAYYQRDGWVYHPEGRSVFVDDLQTHLADHRGRLVRTGIAIVSHRHPANFSDVVKDDLHNRNETQAIWDKDKATYERLKKELIG